MRIEQRLAVINENQKKVRNLSLGIVDSDPWVPMKIGGKSYKFELSMGAVEDIFRQTGLTLGVTRITPDIIVNNMPVLLLAGLRTHHSDEFGVLNPDAELETESQRAIMRKLPIKHMNYYVSIVEDALSATEPDPEQLAALMEATRDAMNEMENETEARPLAVVPISEQSGLSAESLVFPEKTPVE